MYDAPQDLLDGPAHKAPPGVIVHLSRTSPEQKWYFICVPLFTVIPGIFLILRLYTKIKIIRKLDLTDCKHHTHGTITALRIDLTGQTDFVVTAFVRLSQVSFTSPGPDPCS
jgi:hypothetical protein